MDCEVTIVPAFAQAEHLRKQCADSSVNGVFSRTISTFDAWLADLWELFGDGRTLIGQKDREVAMQLAFGYDPEIPPGSMALACACVRKAAGLSEFEHVLEEIGSGNNVAGISIRERRFLEGVIRYFGSIDEIGFIEPGSAASYLAAQHGRIFPHPVRIESMLDGNDRWIEKRFFESCPEISATFTDSMGTSGTIPSIPIEKVRFAFPAGKLAEPGLIADIVCERARAGRILITCADPLEVAARLADRLAEFGLTIAVADRIPFSQTEFGRAVLGLYHVTHDDQWNKSLLSDVLSTAFSGFTSYEAQRADTMMRADRSMDRDEVLAYLRARSIPFSQLEELVEDPDADILLGAFDQIALSASKRSFSWCTVERRAISATRDAMESARRFHAGIDACVSVLERTAIPVSLFYGSADSSEYSEGFSASLMDGSVVIADQNTAATLGCAFQTVIIADLTNADYPVADQEDSAITLFEKIGLVSDERAIDRSRRTFAALLDSAKGLLYLLRPLGDTEADETRPAAVLEEFIDLYRKDPSATDDIDNRYHLPELLQTGLSERGEEILYANAVAGRIDCVQERSGTIPTPRLGQAGVVDLTGIATRNHDATREDADLPCLSPSQIEAYLECPYKWFATRHLRIGGLDEAFGPLERGTFSHAVLETFYRRFNEEGFPKVTPENISRARMLMADVFDRLLAEQRDLTPLSGRYIAQTQLEFREADRLRAQLIDFVDFESHLLPTFRPAYLEYRFDADHIVEYGGCTIRGTVDRIDIDDAGRAVVIDYKGSIGPDYSIADKTIERSGKIQALIYAEAVRRVLGLNVVAALYVSYGKKPSVTGAFDVRSIEAAHLPGPIKAEKASCGSGGVLLQDPAPDQLLKELSFDQILQIVEEKTARAISAMDDGRVDPDPSSTEVCRYCPAVSCPKRGV